MAKKGGPSLNQDPASTPREENKPRKSWAEEHGGWIFIGIVVSVISFAVLYDSCMY